MLTLETTAKCPRVPVFLFTLEELGCDYEITVRPDGYFNTTYGTIGPALIDGDLTLLRIDSAVRYASRYHGALLPTDTKDLARCEAWMELLSSALRPAIVRVARGRANQEPDEGAEETFRESLAILEKGLEDRPFLLGDELTAADCPYIVLRRLPLMAPSMMRYPNLNAYTNRLLEREAWSRTQAKMSDLAVSA